MALNLFVIIRIFTLKIAVCFFISLFLMSCGKEKQADSIHANYGIEITPVELTGNLYELTNHDQTNIVIKSDLVDHKEKGNSIRSSVNKEEHERFFHFHDTEIKISKDFIEIKIPTKDLINQDNGDSFNQENFDNRRKVNLTENEKPKNDHDSLFIFNF